MQLYYEGSDLTNIVNVTSCVHRDAACGRADSLEIEFDHAAVWYNWGPQIDDAIQVIQDGYDTGKMYLNTILPEGDRFRVIATSLPSSAAARAWYSFRDTTLDKIMDRCAAECGMTYKLFGIDGGTYYTYLLRRNEGCAALIDRLARMENVYVKAFNGAFRVVSLDYAQEQNAAKSLYITANQDGVRYIRQDNKKLSSLTVQTPYAAATAKDGAAINRAAKTITDLPAHNNVEAGRWARGLLTANNRQAESLTVSFAFDPAMSALTRIDVDGNTDAVGAWIVEEAEQDIKNGRTRAKLYRVIDTIS
ncbi:MAG: hypothetical protein IJ523_10575 [Succinivibrionaceae bacterium]|nr:hypothetical protein [Succinivibrionaceae bacterium]